MPNQKHINKKHLAHLEVVRRQDRIIRISALVIILLVVGVVAYGFLSNTVLMQYRTVAEVNGDKIQAGEFQTQVKIQRIQAINRYMQYLQYAQMFGIQDPLNDANFGPMLKADSDRLNSTETMGQEVIDLLINDRLIRQEAAKRGIAVSNEEVEKALQESFAFFANGTPTLAPTSTTFVTPTLNPTQLAIVTITPTSPPAPTATQDPQATPTLVATVQPTATTGPTSTPAPTATAVNEEGYKTLLKERIDGLKTDANMDEADYRNMIYISLLRDKLLEDITKDISESQEQVWARHILVATEEEANGVIARINSGEDFGKLASELSTDTGSRESGGDLGWFAKGAMVAPFEETAFSLAIGEISAPVKSDFGFHIIQVLGHEERPVDAQQFTQNKSNTFNDFIQKLRDESDVQIFDLWKTIVPTEPAMPAGVQ
jgi:peptidyl-prolyl cis-trans isomerase D